MNNESNAHDASQSLQFNSWGQSPPYAPTPGRSSSERSLSVRRTEQRRSSTMIRVLTLHIGVVNSGFQHDEFPHPQSVWLAFSIAQIYLLMSDLGCMTRMTIFSCDSVPEFLSERVCTTFTLNTSIHICTRPRNCITCTCTSTYEYEPVNRYSQSFPPRCYDIECQRSALILTVLVDFAPLPWLRYHNW